MAIKTLRFWATMALIELVGLVIFVTISVRAQEVVYIDPITGCIFQSLIPSGDITPELRSFSQTGYDNPYLHRWKPGQWAAIDILTTSQLPFTPGGIVIWLVETDPVDGGHGLIIEGLNQCANWYISHYHIPSLQDWYIGKEVNSADLVGQPGCSGNFDCQQIPPHTHTSIFYCGPLELPNIAHWQYVGFINKNCQFINPLDYDPNLLGLTANPQPESSTATLATLQQNQAPDVQDGFETPTTFSVPVTDIDQPFRTVSLTGTLILLFSLLLAIRGLWVSKYRLVRFGLICATLTTLVIGTAQFGSYQRQVIVFAMDNSPRQMTIENTNPPEIAMSLPTPLLPSSQPVHPEPSIPATGKPLNSPSLISPTPPPTLPTGTPSPISDPLSACQITGNFPQEIMQWCELITKYSLRHNIPPNLIAAQMWQESRGDPLAYSHSGAVGLMQVMPRDGIAKKFHCQNGPCFAKRPSTEQLQDPEFNVSYATYMMAELYTKHGSWRLALKDYGPMDVGFHYADLVLAIQAKYSP